MNNAKIVGIDEKSNLRKEIDARLDGYIDRIYTDMSKV